LTANIRGDLWIHIGLLPDHGRGQIAPRPGPQITPIAPMTSSRGESKRTRSWPDTAEHGSTISRRRSPLGSRTIKTLCQTAKDKNRRNLRHLRIHIGLLSDHRRSAGLRKNAGPPITLVTPMIVS
jgi:hypothetical protein